MGGDTGACVSKSATVGAVARGVEAVEAWLDRTSEDGSAPGPKTIAHRRRTQRALGAVGIVAFSLSLLGELLIGPEQGKGTRLGLFTVGLGMAAAVPTLQRLTRRYDLPGHLVALTMFGFGLIGTATTGGLASPTVFWLPMTPLVAFVAVGARAALGWVLAALLGVLALLLLELQGVTMPDLLVVQDPSLRATAHVLAVTVVVFAISFAWDSSQRVVVSDLRDARDRARTADQAKSNLVAIVSHELRTPMNGVLGMLDLLRDTALDDTQGQLADTARGAARSLLDILDDLLDRSRLDAGRLGLDAISFRPEDVVRNVQHLVDLGGFGRSVPVHVELGEALDRQVTGDPRRLRQILTNLLGNALKFTDEGEVVIRVHGEPIGEKLRLVLEVSDTGIGIPEARLPHVFDAFTQVDGTITRRFGGTGLGLSITRDLVEMMGGTIEVFSRVDEGSTFVAHIPFPMPPETSEVAAVEPVAPAPLLAGLRVLVAEDNAVNQMVIRGYLQRYGIQPEVVEDGEAAVFAALERPFDLVLMDCEMPVMDGFRAARTLRDQGYTTPIVALTAHASARVRQRCLESGMDAFLSKPLSTGALLTVLTRYLSQRPVALA